MKQPILEINPQHPVVLRLADDVCRHLKAGKARGEIERLLAKYETAGSSRR